MTKESANTRGPRVVWESRVRASESKSLGHDASSDLGYARGYLRWEGRSVLLYSMYLRTLVR